MKSETWWILTSWRDVSVSITYRWKGMSKDILQKAYHYMIIISTVITLCCFSSHTFFLCLSYTPFFDDFLSRALKRYILFHFMIVLFSEVLWGQWFIMGAGHRWLSDHLQKSITWALSVRLKARQLEQLGTWQHIDNSSGCNMFV